MHVGERLDLLRHLDFFVAIAEEQHFGAAARRLGITQPPLSQGLQRLEADLGVRLVDRSSRGVQVTEAGTELLPLARQLLLDAGQLRARADQHAREHVGVRLGVIGQLPPTLVAAVAAAYGTAVTGGVSVQTAPTAALVESVVNGRLDVAVVHHPAVTGDLRASDVVLLSTALLLPATGPAPMRGGRLRDLVRWPVLTPPRGHNPPAHDLFSETLVDHGVQAGVATAEDERTALALVAAGQACLVTADSTLGATGVRRVAVPGDVLPLRVRAVAQPRPAPHLPADLAGIATEVLSIARAATGAGR